MNPRRVVITGLGLVSSLGIGTRVSWNNLLSKACGIRNIEKPGYASLPCRVAGAVDDEELELQAKKILTASNLKSMGRCAVFNMLAAEEALTQAKWKPEDEEAQNYTGVSIGSNVDMKEIYDASVKSHEVSLHKGVGPFFLTRILNNMPAAHVSIKYKFRGPQMSNNTACATGLQAIGDGYRAIQNGTAKVLVCGGTEAPINPLLLAAFCKIRALATHYESASTASRPFDAGREGFVFGEGAGLMVLEELQHAEARGATLLGEILGFGSCGDAHHLTAPHPDGDGALRSMQAAIKEAGLTPDDIGFINAHATSTPLGDAAESKAIVDLMSERDPKLSPVLVTSNKGAIGHLQSACGAVEAVFTALSCADGLVPLTLNLTSPQTGCDLDYVMSENRKWTTNGARRIALSNSFGFGGVNSTLCVGEVG